MSILRAPDGPTHDLGGTRFTTLATPSLGTSENAVWLVEIDPGVPATPHRVTREEMFVVLDGIAATVIGGRPGQARPGDVVVVPAHTEFEIANAGADGGLRMLCCMPVGGEAVTADGRFTPPWAA